MSEAAVSLGPAPVNEPQKPNEESIPSEVQRAALVWQVMLWSGEVMACEQQEFDRWYAADPAHQHAWQQVQRINQHLQLATGAVASRVLRVSRPSKAIASRRTVLRSLALIAVAATIVWGVRETPAWQAARAEQRTARGEQRDLVLTDGTRVVLNTATAIDLEFTNQERRVLLRTGEVLITTAHEPSSRNRPFVVETSKGSIRALGTQFTVRDLVASPAEVLVQVLEGAVEIAPLGGKVARIEAGQQARFSEYGVQSPKVIDPTGAAWSKGLLVAERMPLGDFLTELGRYRTGTLHCDPAVADLVVSGVYPLADTDRVLQSLAEGLPVTVHTKSRYWVTVGKAIR